MITFNLNFTADQDTGNLPSQAQQDAMRLAAQQWGALFQNTATINLTVNSETKPNSDTLMSAGSEFLGPNPGFGIGEVIRRKILTGEDINGSEIDGTITVNWGINWELDFNETPNESEDEFDFYSTFYHEISHALGLSSSITENGSDGFEGGSGTTASGQPGSWSAFDQFVTDSSGNPVVNNGLVNPTEYRALLEGGNSADNLGLFFSGPRTIAANGGQRLGLYTPTTFEEGSSGSHLDDENHALTGSIMLAATGPGPSARTLTAVERAVFEDLGYSFVAPTPMPTVAAPTDLDRNGTSDILWRNRATNGILWWQMQNNGVLSAQNFPGMLPSEGWDVAGMADFDRDGNLDLIARNRDGNITQVWLLDENQNLQETVDVVPENRPDQGWQIVGVDDFNGDSRPDLLWRNQTSGQFLTWYLGGTQGASLNSGALFNLGLIGLGNDGLYPDLNWKVKATGDFNGDQSTDLVWHHQQTGQVAIWQMDNQANLIGGYLMDGVPDLSWKIMGSGDYNGDGKSDLMWQHQGVGTVALWALDQSRIIGGGVLGNVDANSWQHLV